MRTWNGRIFAYSRGDYRGARGLRNKIIAHGGARVSRLGVCDCGGAGGGCETLAHRLMLLLYIIIMKVSSGGCGQVWGGAGYDIGMRTMVDAQRILETQKKYGLTPKQAAYALETVDNPTLPVLERARRAGYKEPSAEARSYAILKKPSIISAIEGLAAERAAVAGEKAEYDRDPRGYLASRHLANSTKKDVTSTQVASLDLLGKIAGVYQTHVTVDIGEDTRRALLAGRVQARIISDILPQPSQITGETEE